MTEKTITISGKEAKIKASAAILQLYRIRLGRDSFRECWDRRAVERKARKTIPVENPEIFENVACIMALHADASVPRTIDEWIDQFEMFSIVNCAC